MARDCLTRAKDLSGLLLLHTATGSAPGMQALVGASAEQGKHNVEFLAAFLLGRLDYCVDLLVGAGRIPEAAFFARTYLPSRISEVGFWRIWLEWAMQNSMHLHGRVQAWGGCTGGVCGTWEKLALD